MENITSAQKNKMALTYGSIAGIIYIVLATVSNAMVANFVAFTTLKVVTYILFLVSLGVLAARIRKANGGYIEFREVFGAIFVMVLVASFMYYLYSYLYIEVIDKEFVVKIKTSTISFMEKLNTPDDKIEEAVRKMDQQMAEAKKFNIGTFILSFFQGLIMDCLFGLLVALIVKKQKPVFSE